MEKVSQIVKLLPKYNCKACGYKRCDIFAEKLLSGETSLDKCPFLFREDFKENLKKLEDLLKDLETGIPREARKEEKECRKYIKEEGNEKPTGLIDGYKADFLLDPLPDEHSCRETLLIIDRTPLKVGDLIKYRPLGCPLPHFARIIDENHGLYVVHIEGPCHRITGEKIEYKDVGIAMVAAFEGMAVGKVPEVGQTVKFIPTHCMMQKVHSGVVVEVEGKRVYIEGIDLKIW